MLKTLNFTNFKSWRATQDIKLAPITGFFGTNSSGKSSILQFLLMLKQTVESNDQQRVLHLGSDRTYVDLGTSYDILNQPAAKPPNKISFSLSWQPSTPEQQLSLPARLAKSSAAPEISTSALEDITAPLKFQALIHFHADEMRLQDFAYTYESSEQPNTITMQVSLQSSRNPRYRLTCKGRDRRTIQNSKYSQLPPPTKFYGFPSSAKLAFSSGEFVQELSLGLEQVFNNIAYLGPLRDFPKRSYTWSGERPQDVGRRGELAVAALLAAKKRSPKFEIKIAQWLKALGLVADFAVEPIAPNRRDYEVRIRSRPNSEKTVLITDVGFGVSQILPVLVLCYYAPEGSTVILEQPEIHLHPSVQAGLADIFVEVAKERNLQIILESHSEHLLRRLQRRIAEAQIPHDQTALYFCDMDDTGASHLLPLALDEFGNINNWPTGFFGDEMGDLVAMTEAAMQRQMAHE